MEDRFETTGYHTCQTCSDWVMDAIKIGHLGTITQRIKQGLNVFGNLGLRLSMETVPTLEASFASSPSFRIVTVWPLANNFFARYRPKGE
eukprot:530764-Prorocentrum_minimum.AAC.3